MISRLKAAGGSGRTAGKYGKDKLLFLRIPLTPNEVHILSRYHCRIAGAVGWSCDYRHLQFQDRAALFLTFRTLASHQRLWKFYNKM
ncbi:hypothetical protein I7I53_02040 [Histoplasma capsulatum var. duboisii H88]|uniref:Uncharacterized protein n=1 Tax=Ajellomyces capsulatus (strain H88) TaxID=544711 RepID=A0A8A1LPX2_AJEC8|nr:hypothetical protein I7I53_02040 [Histoplasma capsulatum var. duboisii H88]